jgi:peptidyl-tRNA hydrolase, PTH2 family
MAASSSPAEPVSPWLYSLAGAAVSAITLWFFNNNNKNNTADYDSDDDDADEFDATQPRSTSTNSKDWGPQDAPYKMLLVVNTSLNMGKGKIAAQCGHAAVGAYKRASKQCPNAVRWWERTGCAKIAVKCPSEEELASIYQAARAKDIPLYLVEDAGRTQIAAGSRTVLGLGPAPKQVFEGVTSHLKLM